MKVNNDHFLIKKTLEGDNQCFAELVEKYQHMVYTLCMKMMEHPAAAEEVAQNVFIKLYKGLSTYNAKSKFSTWLYRITYNSCLDELNKKKRSRTDDLENVYGSSFEIEEDADPLEQDDKSRLIKDAIHQLSKEDRMVVLLFYYEEMSIKEIAKALEMSQGNIRIRLHRSREKLATLLEDKLSII